MSSDLCYKSIQLTPQRLLAANDACFWTQKWIGENISDFFNSTIFHVVFHSVTINDASGSVAFKPTLIMNSRYFCLFASQISVWQCKMTGNVMKWGKK